MSETLRCQSCGMPLHENVEYCELCYKDGAFTEPGMTLDKMMMRSIAYMTDVMGYSDHQAKRMTESVIPFLKRWVR